MVFLRYWSLSLTGVLCTAAAVGPGTGAGAERDGAAPGKGETLVWRLDERAVGNKLWAMRRLRGATGITDQARGITVQRDGIRGDCLVFDGSGSRVEVRDLPAVNLCAQGTMAAWVRIRGRCRGPRLAIASQPKADGTAWCLYVVSAAPDSGLNLQIGVEMDRDGKPRMHRTRHGGLTHGLWYHVAATVGQGMVRIFMDGVKVLEAPDTGSPGMGQAALIVGNDA
ncbi:MAG: LamG domain-containing protein, partial [Planctomycetes bacterium]|nr:LamG domain-containing protein [Planctomycetota bacterium]